MIRVCRVVEMVSPQRKINKIGFGARILRAATSAVALTATGSNGTALDGRAQPTTSQIQLNTAEQIAQVNIPYDVMEDNIERATTATNELSNTAPAGLRQTIIDLIAERAALDMEELGLLGNTSYTNPADGDDQAYLSQFNGWLTIAQTSGNVYDANGSSISKSIFKEGLKSMPSQYQRNKVALSPGVDAQFRLTHGLLSSVTSVLLSPDPTQFATPSNCVDVTANVFTDLDRGVAKDFTTGRAAQIKVLSRELKSFLDEVAQALAGRHGGSWPGGTGAQSLSKRSGALVDSIIRSVKVSGGTFESISGTIGADVPYAGIQEFGGTISAKGGGYLCIPLPAALDGSGMPLRSSPRDWPSTFVAKSKAGNLIIFQRRGTSIVPLYVLKTSVVIPPRLGMRKTLNAGLPYFVERACDAMVAEIKGAQS